MERRPGMGGGADPDELRELYERRLTEFRRVAAAVAGGAEEGRDAVQEAFARALARRRQFRGEAPLEAWVWQIVLNEARGRARARRRAETAAEVEAVPAAPERDRAEVRAALGRLPERERLTLFLRYFADLDYTQIATVLGVESGTVGASLSSGRAKLGRMLREEAG